MAYSKVSHPLTKIGLLIMVLVLLQFVCTEAGGHTSTREEEDQEKQRETTTPMTQASSPDPEKASTAATTPWQGREVSVDTSQLALLLHKQNVTVWMPLPHWLNEPLLPLWVVSLIDVLGLGVASITLCGALLNGCWGARREGLEQTVCTSLNPKHLYDDLESIESVRDWLFREATLLIQLQWIYVVLAVAIAYRLGSVPSWALAVAAPAVLRASWLHVVHGAPATYSAVDGSGANSMCSKLCSMASSTWEFTVSKFEVLDAGSDAIALATTMFLGDAVNMCFIDSFNSTTARTALASIGGLPGTAFIILSYGTIVQLCIAIATWSSAGAYLIATAADLAGLGLLAKKLTTGDVADKLGHGSRPFLEDGQGTRTFFGCVARCFAEAAPQALFQTSVLMATDTELLEQPLLLASVLFSCLTLLKNGILLARSSTSPGAQIIAITIFLVLSLVLAKLYAIEACQSRVWGPATGCIPMSMSGGAPGAWQA